MGRLPLALGLGIAIATCALRASIAAAGSVSFGELPPATLRDVVGERETISEPVAPAVVSEQADPPAATAPLPPAVFAGAAMLAGNFVLVRFLKRKLR